MEGGKGGWREGEGDGGTGEEVKGEDTQGIGKREEGNRVILSTHHYSTDLLRTTQRAPGNTQVQCT